jgi:hypothetical protein
VCSGSVKAIDAGLDAGEGRDPSRQLDSTDETPVKRCKTGPESWPIGNLIEGLNCICSDFRKFFCAAQYPLDVNHSLKYQHP